MFSAVNRMGAYMHIFPGWLTGSLLFHLHSVNRKVLYKFVAALGAESVREDFIAARAAHASGTELSASTTPPCLGWDLHKAVQDENG